MRGRFVLAVLCLVCASAAVGAQTAGTQPRPRIGLALGGGVARGVAHIGVIEWLEEHHVPVDVIAGTSAGGLVGGAYATGMTPEELRALMRSVDWDTMFQSDAPYALLDFRRKEDARDYPAPIEFGLRKGFRLPSSIGASEQVDLFLSWLSRRYYDIRTFDELPIPFRCVATDLIAEEPVVLSDGPLAEAMRATMAFPGLFSPVMRDGRMLADGGVLNNVPADVVRAMGADIVIAVDVGGTTPLEPGFDSAITVMSRTIDVLTDRNAREAMKAADIIVRPDIKDIQSMDWRRSDEIADRGYRAATADPRLAALSVDDVAWTAYLASRDARRVKTEPVPTLLSVSGVPPQEQEIIRNQLVHHLGHPLDGDVMRRELTAITGSARYDTVTYQLVRRAEGTELAIKVTPKSYGPPFLRFTLDVTNAGTTMLAVGVRGRLTAFDLAGYGSELRLDSMVGTGFSLKAELYRPLGKSHLFVAPRAGFQVSDQETFLDTRRMEDYRVNRVFAGADVGVSLSRTTEWRLGYTYGRATAKVEAGPAGLPRFTGPESMAHMEFIYDGQDAPVVPSRGVRVDATLLRILKGVEPDTATPAELKTGRRTVGEIITSAYMSVRRRHRVMLSFSGGTSFGSSTDSYYDFTLGGPMRLRAYRLGEFRGLNYMLGTAAYLHNLGRLPDFLGGQLYVAGIVESGCTFANLASARLRTVVSSGFVVDTLLGPVSLSAGVSVDGHFRFYANVGRTFR
jgi:NTE family protein